MVDNRYFVLKSELENLKQIIYFLVDPHISKHKAHACLSFQIQTTVEKKNLNIQPGNKLMNYAFSKRSFAKVFLS